MYTVQAKLSLGKQNKTTNDDNLISRHCMCYTVSVVIKLIQQAQY